MYLAPLFLAQVVCFFCFNLKENLTKEKEVLISQIENFDFSDDYDFERGFLYGQLTTYNYILDKYDKCEKLAD